MFPSIFFATLDPAISGSDTGSLPPAGFAAQSNGIATNFLSGSDTSSLQVNLATDSFIIGGWINAASLPVDFAILMTNGDQNNGAEYWAAVLLSSGKVGFYANVDSTGTDDSVQSTQVLSTSTNYFLLMWYTPSTTTLAIQVNANTAHTKVVTVGTPGPVGGVQVFSNTGNLYGFAGIMDEWFFCKNPSNLNTAISTIQTNIYNGGTGLRYKNVSSADKTTIGLVSWWTFDQASGAARTDSQSTNNLTLHGTISQVAPIVA